MNTVLGINLSLQQTCRDTFGPAMRDTVLRTPSSSSGNWPHLHDLYPNAHSCKNSVSPYFHSLLQNVASKASAIKIKILVFLIWNGPCFESTWWYQWCSCTGGGLPPGHSQLLRLRNFWHISAWMQWIQNLVLIYPTWFFFQCACIIFHIETVTIDGSLLWGSSLA